MLRFFRLLINACSIPWRMFQSVRHSMTAASATVLIVSIITLNIIWGYPWVGMFSAMIAMMVVGWTLNRLLHPKLRIGFSLPASTPAGTPFRVLTHAENRGRLPAFDLSFDFDAASAERPVQGSHRWLSRFRYWRSSRRNLKSTDRSGRNVESLSPDCSVALIQPHAHVEFESSLRYSTRGVHQLPDVIVHSMFPFHLFRSTRRVSSGASIAITPRLLNVEEDSFSREMLSALGGWSRKLFSGDDLDYTGSREYQTGMPVRRWDFSSWARLGRPIVREFQSPAIQSVTLLVDTARPKHSEFAANGKSVDHDALFERLLSLAATAIHELNRKLVLVRMYLSDEDPAMFDDREFRIGAGSDVESLLIRLAACGPVRPAYADRSIASVWEQVGRNPVLVLSLRPDAEVWRAAPATVSILRRDRSHADPSPPLAEAGAWPADADQRENSPAGRSRSGRQLVEEES